MDQLDAMRTLVKIADTGSLTAAARALGVSVAAVTRGLAAIEKRLGVRLVNRTTRRTGLTEPGVQYYEHCRRVLAEIESAEAALSAQRTLPTGTLNVSAPVLFGRMHLAPLLPDFLSRHDGVTVNLVLADRLVNLVDEGFDLAIRIGQLADSLLVATRLGSTRRVVCASPDYLRRHGRPRVPADLRGHHGIRFTVLNPGHEWAFRTGGRTRTVRVPCRLSCNNADAVIAAAVRGQGIATVLSYQIERELAAGELEIVLREFEPPLIPIHAVHPHGRLLSGKTRAFIEFMIERLNRRGS